MIAHINNVRQLQSSYSLNTKATLVVIQLKLTTSLQFLIMVKLWLIITVYILHTYAHIKSKL
jgi:hypothetical protein